jgi:hypothetical protein
MATQEFAQWKYVQSKWSEICYKWNSPASGSGIWDLVNNTWDAVLFEWDDDPIATVACPVTSSPVPLPIPTPTPIPGPAGGIGAVGSNSVVSSVLTMVDNSENQQKEKYLAEIKNCSVTIVVENNFFTEERKKFTRISRAYPRYEEKITNFPIKILTESTNPQYKNAIITEVKFSGK